MGLFIPFTSSELYAIRNMARQDYSRAMWTLRADIKDLRRTGLASPFNSLIARDMDELARLRRLIAHTNQQLKVALEREAVQGRGLDHV